jgi:teichuronic acid biosynthesis glycosyltransferase TuaH
MTRGPRVGMLSLEHWDEVWRRNQHFAARLVRTGVVESLVFVTPPRGGLALRSTRWQPMAGIDVLTPPLLVPRRFGGHRVLARWLRRALSGVDVLWINDPVAGVGSLRDATQAVYDVTDDWREMPQNRSDRARIVSAEDVLARRALTVVCSSVLAERWRARYAVEPTVIQNGVDIGAIQSAVPRSLDGSEPHAVYVGTQHRSRLDVDLLCELALSWAGSVHLVGPDYLDPSDRDRLNVAGIRLHGAVAAPAVPSWLVAADVLICPHLIDPFSLSLDAIKSHEYLATGRPVVATASSGFQSMAASGLWVVDRGRFVETVCSVPFDVSYQRDVAVDWDDRAAAFAEIICRATVWS